MGSVKCLPCKPLAVLICLAVKLWSHRLHIMSLKMMWWMNFAVSLGIQISLLICRAWFSNCHTKPLLFLVVLTWSILSEDGIVLTLNSLIRNHCICCLLMLPLLLNSMLFWIILSLLVYLDSLLTRAGYLFLPLNVQIRSWWLKCWVSLLLVNICLLIRKWLWSYLFPLILLLVS